MIRPRQLRKLRRNVKRRMLKEMREDLYYLLKPRPRFFPRWLWIKFLRYFLDLDLTQLNKIK